MTVRIPKAIDLSGGLRALLATDDTLPLVDVEFVLRTGAVHDPRGQEGLTRMTWRVARMGTEALRAEELEEEIAALGGRLAIQIAPSSVRLSGVVIARNLEPFFALLAEILQRPALRAADLTRAKREVRDEFRQRRDSDRSLAGRAFRTTLYGTHPYARPLTGTPESLRRIDVAALKGHHRRHLHASNLIVGVAGPLSRGDLRRLLAKYLSDLPGGRAPKEPHRAPKVRRGRHLVVVNKPGRSQSPVLIGGLGIVLGHPSHPALSIGNAAFGGMFTSRLTQEVRELRGWSYGATSTIGADRMRDAWIMSTAPSSEYLRECIELELSLLEQFSKKGITAAEFRRTRGHLIESHCFEVDTAGKRLSLALEEELYGLPAGTIVRWPSQLRRATHARVNGAIRRWIPRRDLTLALVATARTALPELKKIPGIDSVTVIPYRKM
ncbi:MAG: insulinase family protein [Myxococcales bacterium]|nr:insulinase family protein [Myxococcales bacterium]